MKLSISICNVIGKREEQLDHLISKLSKQILVNNLIDDVELRVYSDNGTTSVGAKRNMAIEKANGEYVAFIDDDDDISENYLQLIFAELDKNYDAIFIRLLHKKDNQEKIIIPSQHIYFETDGMTFIKNYFHLCPIKKSIALQVKFPEVNFAEDMAYSSGVSEHIKNSISIEQPVYIYNDNISQSLTRC